MSPAVISLEYCKKLRKTKLCLSVCLSYTYDCLPYTQCTRWVCKLWNRRLTVLHDQAWHQHYNIANIHYALLYCRIVLWSLYINSHIFWRHLHGVVYVNVYAPPSLSPRSIYLLSLDLFMCILHPNPWFATECYVIINHHDEDIWTVGLIYY